MKPGLVAVILFGLLGWLALATYGCNGLQVDTKDQNVPAQEAQAEAPKGFTITLPAWSFFAYTTPSGEVLVTLSVKDPATFGVPREFTFTQKDGSQVKAELMRLPKRDE
jgi:hypothetical protein